jgi:RNA polymerase sigma-B factor
MCLAIIGGRDTGMARPDGATAASRRELTADLLQVYRETGDRSARKRLIELHLPLVRVLARRYAHRGERLEDLVQVGSVALIEAIDRFDPEKGTDLACFAVPTITGEIKNHLRDRAGVVRIPRRLVEHDNRVRAARDRLSARLCRQPTLSELAREAGIPEDEAAAAIERGGAPRAVSLQTVPVTPEEDGVVAVDDVFDSSEDRLLLAAGFRTLDARQRRILHLRFFAGLSQAEIAREVGLSQIQVSRVIRASLERMRGALGPDETHGPVENRLARL